MHCNTVTSQPSLPNFNTMHTHTHTWKSQQSSVVFAKVLEQTIPVHTDTFLAAQCPHTPCPHTLPYLGEVSTRTWRVIAVVLGALQSRGGQIC